MGSFPFVSGNSFVIGMDSREVRLYSLEVDEDFGDGVEDVDSGSFFGLLTILDLECDVLLVLRM